MRKIGGLRKYPLVVNSTKRRTEKRDFVNDNLGGGPDAMTEKLMGEVEMPDGSPGYRSIVPRTTSQGRFSIKFMNKDGEYRREALEKFEGNILGLPGDT